MSDIRVSTLTVQFSTEDRRQLANILQVRVQDLSTALVPYVEAAAEEYARMVIGQRVYTRGSDIREYRLFLLIKHAFGGRIPDEQTVSSLFQTTIVQSRSLIRSVMSKFQYDLAEAITATVRAIIEAAEEEGTDFLLTSNNESIIAEINQRLAGIDGSLIQVSRKRGTVSVFVIKRSSLARLRQALDLPALPEPQDE